MGRKATDLTGKIVGRLTVLRRHIGNSADGHVKWVCKCTCGRETIIASNSLAPNRTRSCGCFLIESRINKTIHGHARKGKLSREYTAWTGMKFRCSISNKTRSSKNYIGKGITVCDEWFNSFETFLKDMGTCPEGYEIDRIDNNLGYFKENCRWVDELTQGRNTSSVKLNIQKAKAIRKDTRVHKIIAKDYGISKSVIHAVKANKTWKES